MPRRPWQTEEWKKRRKEILLIRNKCEWCGKTKNLHLAHKKHAVWQDDNPQYLLCADKDIRVLCTRCHFAEHKNLTKCPTCDGYKVEWNEVCSKCFRKEHPQEESWDAGLKQCFDEEDDDDYYDD